MAMNGGKTTIQCSYFFFWLFMTQGVCGSNVDTGNMFVGDFGESNTMIHGKNHPCYRECDGKAMICEYNFTITAHTTMSLQCKDCPYNATDCSNIGCVPGGGIARPVIAANQMIPGPSILVCENDTVSVDVKNLLPTISISIHWHGVHQEGTPYMDGVPYITQCPINPYNTFKYTFRASPPGTHMWHGHSGFQESDGLFGQLIVRRKETDEVKTLYDYDLPEHSIIVWHWYDQPTGNILRPDYHRNLSVDGYGFLINGKASFKTYERNEKHFSTPKEVFHVQKGKKYRFRMSFNSAIYCPIQVSVDSHQLVMIASDGTSFKPVEVDSFMITAGERFDFVLGADKKADCYYLRFRGFGDCKKNQSVMVHEEAFICYDNASLPDPSFTSYQEGYRVGKLLNPQELSSTDYKNSSLIFLSSMKSTELNEPNIKGEPNITLYIQIHSRNYDVVYPGAYHEFNNVSFSLPGPVLLLERYTITDKDVCYDGNIKNYCYKNFCSCRYINDIALNSLVEIVFVDITQDRFQDHPIHLHGYKFYILSSERVGVNSTVENIKERNELGLIVKNFENPIAKDSFSVPNKGFAVVRFIANNPGFWMLHCHITNHMELGMAMVFKVGENEEMAPVPEGFPTCFNNLSNKAKNHYDLKKILWTMGILQIIILIF